MRTRMWPPSVEARAPHNLPLLLLWLLAAATMRWCLVSPFPCSVGASPYPVPLLLPRCAPLSRWRRRCRLYVQDRRLWQTTGSQTVPIPWNTHPGGNREEIPLAATAGVAVRARRPHRPTQTRTSTAVDHTTMRNNKEGRFLLRGRAGVVEVTTGRKWRSRPRRVRVRADPHRFRHRHRPKIESRAATVGTRKMETTITTTRPLQGRGGIPETSRLGVSERKGV